MQTLSSFHGLKKVAHVYLPDISSSADYWELPILGIRNLFFPKTMRLFEIMSLVLVFIRNRIFLK